MRSRESFDEFKVSFWELIRVKFGWSYPAKLCNIDRARLTLNDCAIEEVKSDGL
jgi:hypothetical protein